MKSIPNRIPCVFIMLSFLLLSCEKKEHRNPLIDYSAKNELLFVETMQKHLNAVSNKDLKTLKSTLSPKGNMQLILPKTEITNTVADFIAYHKAWFASKTPWTFETKILNTEIGTDFGIAITEIIYREPERNGKPYFNRMHVSYALQKIDNTWYIIKDHASSIEKSTDLKQE
ncbi:nuclear transport factor 2 family protein [Oceanihabitans sp. 2_MG-2023]|uniref:YybH family protein n=1 Tax=Oceanihabitans sp. 2_MG-2023 TaxID=3062661 RepID=UPI0026E47450|nr:nuclear transport factor 2 family protein [Oceanihabitans sp. 2_MG-2023]MDO6597196.1 nuclear transport factor 2 family protein [Oceanihabitans sp. 2_MG-2023]